MPRRNGTTPQRFTPRAGSGLPGRIRRALDGQVDTDRRIDGTLRVSPDGRQGVNVAKGGGLKEGPKGLMLDEMALGEMNRPTLKRIKEPASTDAADVFATVCELLNELRRTKNMR